MSNLPNFPNFNNFNFNNFNSFIQQANNAVKCDSNCQKEKSAEELKQKYLASKTNLASAPNQVDVAEKNYVTFTQGELAYNNKKEQELHQKAQIIINKFQDTFKKDVEQINDKINTYNSISVNSQNIADLYLKYKEENIILNKNLKNSTSDVLTNQRKSYYENQGIDTLKYLYKYALLTIYIILVIVYTFMAFLYNSQIKWKKRFGILFLLILLPFISQWILSYTIFLIYKVYELLPKNVHLTI